MYVSRIRLSLAALLSGLVVVVASSLPAQEDATRTRRDRDERRAREGRTEAGSERGGFTDAQLAGWLAVDNENEVALAKLGQERSQNQQVKELSQKLAEAHSQMLTKLQQFAGAGGASGEVRETRRERRGEERRGERGAENPKPENATDNPKPDKPAGDAASETTTRTTERTTIREGRRGGADIVALKRELGEACLQTARQKLEEKEGAEFDKCFIGGQIMGHMQAIDTMKVFKRHASPELAQVLDAGIQAATDHLQQAENIAKQFEGQAAKQANAKTETDNN
jgi:predicted outer membrane protein